MSEIRGVGIRPAPAVSTEERRLREVAQQMEGMFVQQLLKAMRETVPREGVLDGGSGEEMFQGMMDEHLAGLVPQNWDSELGAAIYRQLRGALKGADADVAATTGAGDSH